jgi:hypothetical protein
VNNVGPTVEVSEGELLLEQVDPKLQQTLREAEDELVALNASKAKRQSAWEQAFVAEHAEGKAAEWKSLVPTEFTADGSAALRKLDDDSILAEHGAAKENYRVVMQPTALSSAVYVSFSSTTPIGTTTATPMRTSGNLSLAAAGRSISRPSL